MTKKPESLEQIAQRYEAMVDDDSQDAGLVPVSAQVNPSGGSIIAAHFSRDEFALVARAAENHNLTMTQLIRAAALAAAAGELDLSAAETIKALHEAQAKAQDLADALRRI